MVGMEQIVRRYLAVFVSGDPDDLAELVAPDVVIHGAGAHVQRLRHDATGAQVCLSGLKDVPPRRRPV